MKQSTTHRHRGSVLQRAKHRNHRRRRRWDHQEQDEEGRRVDGKFVQLDLEVYDWVLWPCDIFKTIGSRGSSPLTPFFCPGALVFLGYLSCCFFRFVSNTKKSNPYCSAAPSRFLPTFSLGRVVASRSHIVILSLRESGTTAFLLQEIG